MRPRRLVGWVAVVVILPGFVFNFAPAQGADTKWDPVRTTTPEDVAELKALQDTVKAVVDKTSPATVGLVVGKGAGSGVIVSPDGLVLTVAHVAGAPDQECWVILSDGKRVKGKTLGVNKRIDSGMVQITDKPPGGGKWPHAPIAKST